MTIAYRPRPVTEFNAEEVMDVFLRRGWKGIERNYGTSNDRIQQLKVIIGGRLADAQRRAVQGCGRKAGGAGLTDSTATSIIVEVP